MVGGRVSYRRCRLVASLLCDALLLGGGVPSRQGGRGGRFSDASRAQTETEAKVQRGETRRHRSKYSETKTTHGHRVLIKNLLGGCSSLTAVVTRALGLSQNLCFNALSRAGLAHRPTRRTERRQTGENDWRYHSGQREPARLTTGLKTWGQGPGMANHYIVTGSSPPCKLHVGFWPSVLSY